MAHVEFSQDKSRAKEDGCEKKEPRLQLDRGDLLMFQSIAIHSITVVYELVLRRHAMDRRFQTETCRGRIAALYAPVFFSQSLQSVRWLARMESTHKVRSLWMLCLVYLLQETPEQLIRTLVMTYCDPSVRLKESFKYNVPSIVQTATNTSFLVSECKGHANSPLYTSSSVGE